MSAGADPVRAGRIARLTGSPGFSVLLVIACCLTVPVLFVGGMFTVYALIYAATVGVSEIEIWFVLPTVAGIAGMAGLLRSRQHTVRSPLGRIELTQMLIVIGLLGALAIAAFAITVAVRELDWTLGETLIVLLVVGPLLVLALDGVDRLGRMRALAFERTGVAADDMALVFFAFACVLAVVAALIVTAL